MPEIRNFTDLIAWKEAHRLVLMIYKITQQFPKSELYGLSDQIKRAAVSISSNIAEGFSRNSDLEKKQFYYLSKGSLTEVQNQLIIARDVGYISQAIFTKIFDQSISVSKLISSIIRYVSHKS